jgi:hypothetical protein
LYRSQANFNDLPCNWKLAAFCEQEFYWNNQLDGRFQRLRLMMDL